MFTGLIEDVGQLKSGAARSGGRLAIASSIPREEVSIGDSIAVDGVCLTASSFIEGGFTVDASPETLRRTTLGLRRAGQRVNLERALRLSDRLGGHLVSGHVDGTAVVASIECLDDFVRMGFTAPENILHYIVEKGSVAVDGISLTVNECSERGFSVMIIPHTFSHTTLCERATGDSVNIENDIIAKYVERFYRREKDAGQDITRELLEKFGFS